MTSSPRIRVVSALSIVAVVVAAAATIPADGMSPAACREEKKARAVMRDADGDRIGVVDFWTDAACVTRVVAKIGRFDLSGGGTGLTRGFHGFHVHETGVCDPDAVDPAEDPAPFLTAGGHWSPKVRNHGGHKGDLPPLLATRTGLARANVLTDRFDPDDLLDDDGSAVIVHQDPDNLAHIPATEPDGDERYHSHSTNEMGADETSRSTGDGGSRFACGVVKRI
ncbi:MAG TPA: superoxide dismutase family protein [Actinomycetota bacterium]|nr:superoxide dismutase family protein [Actinomycetota bacterium]